MPQPVQITNSQVMILVLPEGREFDLSQLIAGAGGELIPVQRQAPVIPAEPLALPPGKTEPAAELDVDLDATWTPDPDGVLRPDHYFHNPNGEATFEPTPVTYTTRWDASDYIAWSLMSGLAICGLGIVGTLAYVLYPVVMSIATAVTFLASGAYIAVWGTHCSIP